MVVLGGLKSLIQLCQPGRSSGTEKTSLRLECHVACGRRRKPLLFRPVDRLTGGCGSLRRFAWITGTCCVCTLTAASIRGMF